MILPSHLYTGSEPKSTGSNRLRLRNTVYEYCRHLHIMISLSKCTFKTDPNARAPKFIRQLVTLPRTNPLAWHHAEPMMAGGIRSPSQAAHVHTVGPPDDGRPTTTTRYFIQTNGIFA